MKGHIPKTIDEYIATFPADIQKRLQDVRIVVKKTAPRAEEAIKYNMPTFVLDGYNLAHFAAFTSHIGFYPAPTAEAAFKERLSSYKTGKGSVQFPFEKPLPKTLIADIIKWRIADQAAKAILKKKK